VGFSIERILCSNSLVCHAASGFFAVLSSKPLTSRSFIILRTQLVNIFFFDDTSFLKSSCATFKDINGKTINTKLTHSSMEMEPTTSNCQSFVCLESGYCRSDGDTNVKFPINIICNFIDVIHLVSGTDTKSIAGEDHGTVQ